MRANLSISTPEESISALILLAEGRITRAAFEEMVGARQRGRHMLEAAIHQRLQQAAMERTHTHDRHRRPATRPDQTPLRLVGSWD